SEQARLQRIGQLINKLPEINYQNLCYLVNFLARVAEYSSENKMTPSNLAICIGCSILYGKDQSYSQNQTISNSYTAASIILELMIIHHKQLFNSYYQQEQTSKSFKSQPDIIPTEFHSKSRNDSNENLLDVQNISVYTQPSPGTRRKNKAPRPPPLSSFNQQTSVEQINCENVSSDLNSNDQTSNECLTVTSSLSFSPTDKTHRRTSSDGAQLDRPGAPPPLPPLNIVGCAPIVQPRPKHSYLLSKTNNEQRISSGTEDKTVENETSTDLSTDSTSTTNDGVNVGKLISQINNRMAAGKLPNTQTNNNRNSSFRNSTLSSPGDTTDF
ncbi:unnamed protein product, partial [Rotaria sordida]